MKSLSTILFLFAIKLAFANIITVSNNGFPAMFTSVNSAINAAQNGDTILIAASQNSYGDINLSKQLILIGEVGWPETGNSAITELLNIDSGAEGSLIMGLYIAHNDAIDLSCNDITFERCRIGSNGDVFHIDGVCQNLIVRNCLIQGNITIRTENSLSQSLFENNLIVGNWNGSNFTFNGITNSQQPGIIFRNNIIRANQGQFVQNECTGIHFENNIFWGGGADLESGTTGNSFKNNLSFDNSTTYPIPNNLDLGGNISNQAPIFTNAPDYEVDNSYNYSLEPGSPGENAGSDGMDIGIYGGSFPWPNYFCLPNIPRVTSLSFDTNSVPLGQDINVNVEGTRVD